MESIWHQIERLLLAAFTRETWGDIIQAIRLLASEVRKLVETDEESRIQTIDAWRRAAVKAEVEAATTRALLIRAYNLLNVKMPHHSVTNDIGGYLVKLNSNMTYCPNCGWMGHKSDIVHLSEAGQCCPDCEQSLEER